MIVSLERRAGKMADRNKVGLVGAALLGGWHLVWSILVATGLGQTLYDFILWAHMVHLNIVIGPFNLAASATLIAVTAIFGYVIGYIGAWVWNRVHS
ncbi:MAG: hypothetical protein WBO09_03425 [Methylocystis silviterrae]|uniref:hypothetical protein n=1 Tax=Methylocystis silviterrae TaxID=2743612 RepID=UPI003C7912ED